MGSTIQRRPLRDSRRAPSSPRMPSSGKAAVRISEICRSHSRSAAVTGESSAFVSAVIPACMRWAVSTAARDACTATSSSRILRASHCAAGGGKRKSSGGLFFELSEASLVFREIETGLLGDFRHVEAVAAVVFLGDFGGRINEAIWRGVVGQAFHFLGLVEADGVVHLGLVALAALGLEFFKLAESFLHGPMQTLFVDAQVDEVLGVGLEGSGGGEGGVDIGMLRVEVAGSFEVRFGEHAVFDGAD